MASRDFPLHSECVMFFYIIFGIKVCKNIPLACDCSLHTPLSHYYFTILWWIIISESSSQNNFQVNSNRDNYSDTWAAVCVLWVIRWFFSSELKQHLVNCHKIKCTWIIIFLESISLQLNLIDEEIKSLQISEKWLLVMTIKIFKAILLLAGFNFLL